MSNETVIISLKEKIDDLNQQAWEARVNDSPKSFELSNEAVKLAREINYTKGLAEGLRSLGFCYVRLFKNDEAAPLLRESLSLFQSLNDLRGQAVIYEYLGIIERNWGNLGHSLELLLKGNELVQKVGPLEVEITCSYQIGVTYKHLGDHENALDYLYRALSLAKQTSFTLMEAYATNIIGSIYFDNGNYEQALELYQQGLVIRRQSNDKWGEAGSLDNIGFTYLKLNDLDKAIDFCKQSLAISQGTGDKKGEANALLHLAEIYEQANDVQNASRFSNESLQIRKVRGDKRGEAEVLLFLADLHKNKNDVEDQQIFEWISDALNIANEIKAQDILSKACFNLHEYYQQKGKYKESLAQLEAHLQIEKELHKNAINQKVSNLEISHKAEAISQQNKELTELNKQIEEANAELKIESSLERVRTAAMGMKEPADMLEICKIISHELAALNIKEIRNVQTAIFYEKKGTYMNYEYYAKHDKTFITDVDYNNHPVAKEFAQKMLKGSKEVFAHGFKGEEVRDWLKYQKTTNVFIDTYLETASSLNYYLFSLGPVALGISTYLPLKEEEINLFKRFRNVFELAYRRYLDIEKALAQAREAKVEAALEKVRSRSLAMHKSDELLEVVKSVFERIDELKIEINTAIIMIFSDNSKDAVWWLVNKKNHQFSRIIVKYADFPFFKDLFEARENGKEFLSNSYSKKEKDEIFKYFFEQTDFKYTPEEQKKYILDNEHFSVSVALTKKIGIQVTNYSKNSFSEDENEILKRFARVFDQSYTRFLDLQKAEAQARESQIQLALERVRARTMAMQHSNELQETAVLLFQQVKSLNIPTGSCSFNIWDADEPVATVWSSSVEGDLQAPFKLSHTESPIYRDVYSSMKRGDEILVKNVGGEELKKHFVYLTTVPVISDVINKLKKSGYSFPENIIYHFAFFKQGYLSFHVHELQPEAKDVFIRFAKVFEQTYTRFLDLQKAEAQVREAQIEAAMERTRTQSMIMQHSNELDDTLRVFHEQVLLLGINSAFSFLWLPDEDKDRHIFWAAWKENKNDSKTFNSKAINYPLDRNEAATAQCLIDWKGNEPVVSYHVPPAGVENYFAAWQELISGVEQLKPEHFSDGLYYVEAFMKYGCFGVMVEKELSTEEKKLLLRFAIEFERTYTRFLDLQKAEAQAREAQIELGLERVRARAMAMQKSDELAELVDTVFKELTKLDFALKWCIINIIDEGTMSNTVWAANPDIDKTPESYQMLFEDYPFHHAMFRGWKERQTKYVYTLEGDEKKIYDDYLFSETEFRRTPKEAQTASRAMKKYVVSFSFSNFGGLQTVGDAPLSDANLDILSRFGKVFDLTYTRFNDLKKAEAQAREAQIEAALERVRAKVMAMTNSKDLDETSLVFGEQLRKLNIDWQFSYFWLIEEEKNENTFWITWPDNKTSITIYTLEEAEQYFNECLVSWRAGIKIHDNYVQPADVQPWLDTFQRIADDAGGVAKQIMTTQTFNNGVYYYDAMMKYGSFGVCINKPATDEEKNIQCRFAVEFERAYTRFLDLKKAEAHAEQARLDLIQIQHEKKRAEEALAELQATQKQLIQTEKMASLGELTAGIAHEIQNPLNFVNNFSDVSNELIEEMKEELATGNTQQAIEIANDVKDNLEKILHHGKRADAIVKGMLQHSRSSSGVKEPTDINNLADEYLRLAFHGYRAKDKSFNAKFETNFDSSIERINVIPQDIGRVFLNLINNAFYTVNEKRKQVANGYEPMVVVSTKKVNDKVEISVKDNGNGIPKKMLDKIFQPFFTTKPTGQGTGLGLSLSYDIITKGHAGEIEVKTDEGKGAEFIISLPVN